VTVQIGKLVGFLKGHRKTHIEEYEQACGAYFRKLKDELNILSGQAGANKFRKDNYVIQVVQPVNRESEYNKYIGMLEMAEEETLAISTHQYRCFVDNEWLWAQEAFLSNSTYR